MNEDQKLNNIKWTCNHMLKIHRGLEENPNLKSSIKFFFYEQISQIPFNKAKEFYDFNGLEFTKDMQKAVTFLTSSKSGHNLTYETSKQSNEMYQKWRSELDYDLVEKIQKICGETLFVFNYTMFDEKTLTNFTIPVQD